MHKLTTLTAATMLGLVATLGATDATKPMVTEPAATAPAAAGAVDNTITADPQFTALDTDGDGSLVQSDLPVGHDLGSELFASFDTDSDQRLSAAEFATYAGKPISSADTEEEEAE